VGVVFKWLLQQIEILFNQSIEILHAQRADDMGMLQAEIRALSDRIDALQQEDVNIEAIRTQLGVIEGGVQRVQSDLDSLKPALAKVIKHWREHPEVREMTYREQQEIIGVSRGSIGNAVAFVEENPDYLHPQ